MKNAIPIMLLTALLLAPLAALHAAEGNLVLAEWYSPFEKPVVPRRAALTLEPFSRKRGFDFVSRQLALRYDAEFYLQHGANMGLETKLLQQG